MPTEKRGLASRSIRSLFTTGTSCGLSDAQLLDRFADRDDDLDDAAEAAFETLVLRHGPMVFDVCRNVLGHSQDAEDAFQATFLILATRAASVRRRASVASWLYGVALRTASRSKVGAARRRAQEQKAGESRSEIAVPAEPGRDFGILHEEVGRLPSKYRDPIILCYFEGMTQEMAASQLRCPVGTVGVRLMRAKARLKDRLDRRGDVFAPSIPLMPISGSLIRSTVQSALQFTEAGPVSLAVAQLTKEVSKAMLMMKLKGVAAVLLVAGTVASGAGFLTHFAAAGDPPKKPAPSEIASSPKPAKPNGDLEALQGMWLAKYESPVFAKGVVESVGKRREKWIFDGNFISTFPDEPKADKTGPSATVIPFKITPGQPPKKLEDLLRSQKSKDSPLIPLNTFPDLNTIAAFFNEPTTSKSGQSKKLIAVQFSPDQPAKIDLALPGITNPLPGIYQLHGDWLRICYSAVTRPDKFVGDPSNFQVLVHLKRIPPPANDAVRRSDLEEMQGTWATRIEHNYTRNGVPKTDVVAEKWVVDGKTIRTFPRPAEKLADIAREFTFLITLDPAKTPKVIDLTMPAVGTLEGIYELDGDSLKICWGFRKRPTAFVHDPRNNATLFSLKRLRRTPEEIEPRYAVTPGCFWAVYPSQAGTSSSTATGSLALMTDLDSDRLTIHLAATCENFEAEPYRPVAFDADRKRYYPRRGGSAGVGGTGKDGKNIVVLREYRLDKAALQGKTITHVGVELVTPEALNQERERGFKEAEPKPKP